MDNCIFCKIAQGKIPATLLYEDSQVLAFRDIQPQAPCHILVIPRQHIPSLYHTQAHDAALLGSLLVQGQILAQSQGFAEGARFVFNCGKDGGQTVDHVHLHVLAGRALEWPPG